MQAKQITFKRPQTYAENGQPFTVAHAASAAYSVSVGTASGGSHSYSIPAALTAGEAPVVIVPFAALGFTPAPGVAYIVQVFVTVDSVQSAASKPVSFTNSFTPAAIEEVSVS